MSDLQKFRIYFGKRPATEEELAGVEEITVEQQIEAKMHRPWNATVKMSLCLNERGNWQHAQDDFLQALKRVRIELQLGGRPWVALIDGPIVGRDTAMDSQPGRSNITLTVQDDSVLLNREAAVTVREGIDDDKVVACVIRSCPHDP